MIRRAMSTVAIVMAIVVAGSAYAGNWDFRKNVRRLESVSPEYKNDKDLDKKFLDVLNLTEKTRKDGEIYDEARRIASIPALGQSKYMDSFLYYMLVRSLSASKSPMAEVDQWLGLLKAYDKSPHLLAAQLVRLRMLPKDSPDGRGAAQGIVKWVKAQKPGMKVRAPEYSGNILLGYKPRSNFAEGDYPKLYTLSYYTKTVTPPAGFQEDDLYISLLSRIKDGREDILAEMAGIYKRRGKRTQASAALYELAMLKAAAKDFGGAKTLLDDAVWLNKENAAAKKERDRIKLELTYQSLAPAEPAAPAKREDASSIPEHLTKVEGYLVPPDKVITAEELQGRSKAELRVMRNEVFARHGRIFETADLNAYFGAKPWYREDRNYSDSLLSDVDNQNVKSIQEAEEKAE